LNYSTRVISFPEHELSDQQENGNSGTIRRVLIPQYTGNRIDIRIAIKKM
jgi:hypothetical protein